jgi:hypothetical protein
MIVAYILTLLGSGTSILSIFFQHFGLLGRAASNALVALGWTIFGTGAYLSRTYLWVDISAAMTAWALYEWWKHGGGDGTRKRLRSWGRRFTPVRRTAPQGA